MTSRFHQYYQNSLNILIYLPFIWLGTGLCLTDNGKSVMTKALVIGIVFLLLKYRKKCFLRQEKTTFQLFSSISLFIFCAYLFALDLYHGADKGLIRSLFVTAIYFYLFPLKYFNMNWLKYSILMNALFLAYIIYQYGYVDQISRLFSKDLMNPIPFATYCLFAMITQVHFSIQSANKIEKLLFILAALISCSALIYTESRGVIIAGLFLFIYIAISLLKKLSLKKISALLLVVLIITLSFGFSFKNQITSRYQSTIKEIELLERGVFKSSMGLRLQFWKSGLYTLAEYPILGVGNSHFRAEFLKQYEQGISSKDVLNYSPMHYHNQLLDIAVKNGLIGVGLLILIFCMILFYNRTPLIRYYIIALFICGLTDVPSSHLPLVYFISILILFSIPKNNQLAN